MSENDVFHIRIVSDFENRCLVLYTGRKSMKGDSRGAGTQSVQKGPDRPFVDGT